MSSHHGIFTAVMLLMIFHIGFSTIPAYLIDNYVGTGTAGSDGDNTPASLATVNNVYGVWSDTAGTLFLTEYGGARIRKVENSPLHIISTICGTGVAGYTGNGGQASNAKIDLPQFVFVDTNNNLYIADNNNNRIRWIDLDTGIIRVYAGTGTATSTGNNGKASSATVTDTNSVCGDSSGNLYITEGITAYVRKIVLSTTIITLIAGNGAWSTDVGGANGDKFAASSSSLRNPYMAFPTKDGRIFITDELNYKIRVVGTSSNINLYAGTGSATPATGGLNGKATSATFNAPIGVWVDTTGTGNVYTTEYYTGCNVKRIDGSTSIVVNIAGGATCATTPTGDSGPALNGKFVHAMHLFGDTVGSFFVGDGGNEVRVLYVTNPTRMPSCIPTRIPTKSPTYVPTKLPTLAPTFVPSKTPTKMPTSNPTELPTLLPTNLPTYEPSFVPTLIPTTVPTAMPTTLPSRLPTNIPTIEPTFVPSVVITTTPTDLPTAKPTITSSIEPSIIPSIYPSTAPTTFPSFDPSEFPSFDPTQSPTVNTSSTMPSLQPTELPSYLPSAVPTPLPSDPPSDTPTITPSRIPTQYPTIQPSALPTVWPSEKPSESPTMCPTMTPTKSPTIKPTVVPTQCPTYLPSRVPTVKPSYIPTACPSIHPTRVPNLTLLPTQPTQEPTQEPSEEPTESPTEHPSKDPTLSPSNYPTALPTTEPTLEPTQTPTIFPTFSPSQNPSTEPTQLPSFQPTAVPSFNPTFSPSERPTQCPSYKPTAMPSFNPTVVPTFSPSERPTQFPSYKPTAVPSFNPTFVPTLEPSVEPTCLPTAYPTLGPTGYPTLSPTWKPSDEPTAQPTCIPTCCPTSCSPSRHPINQPTSQPTSNPTGMPSASPWSCPTTSPTFQPRSLPTSSPSSTPSTQPVIKPSRQPVSHPSSQPSVDPSGQPSSTPTTQPFSQPSAEPTSQPNSRPSSQPTFTPTLYRTARPTRAPTTRNNSSPYPGIVYDQFPTNLSVTVHVPLNTSTFRIFLPFLYVAIRNYPSAASALFDIVIPNPSSESQFVVFGGNYTSSLLILGSSRQSFSMNKAISFDYSGRSVSILGDVNDDGYSDLIVGVPAASRCYVLFGTEFGFVNMTEGVIVFGVVEGDLTGWSVSAAGDFNGDGVADIIIGAPNAVDRCEATGCGAVYVIYGGSDLSDAPLAQLTSTSGVVIASGSGGVYMGTAVSNAGDVNGDGIDDVLFGAIGFGNLFAGSAFVIFGSREQRHVIADIANLTTSTGVMLSCTSWNYCGYSVSSVGDVNGDNLADILIGSVPRRDSFGTEMSYLVFGSRHLRSYRDLSSIALPQGIVFVGGGVTVSGLGDINRDGYSDMVIGSSFGLSSSAAFALSFKSWYPRPSDAPTQLPITARPSRLPTQTATKKPTALPTVKFTSVPTRVPTPVPSDPAASPSAGPSEPTIVPSVVPSETSSEPTVSQQPTGHPSMVETIILTEPPTEEPTMSPTVEQTTTSPSEYPTTLPSSVDPTFEPTFKPTNRNLPRLPRPTFSPVSPPTPKPIAGITTVANSTVSYIDIPGLYNRSQSLANNHSPKTSTRYVINSTSPVYIVGALDTSAEVGDVFTIIPNSFAVIEIDSFSQHLHVIDLTSFQSILSFADLNITRGSVVITLMNRHIIRLANLEPSDVSKDNFLFYSSAPGSTTTKKKKNELSQKQLIIQCSVGSACFLLMCSIAYYLYTGELFDNDNTTSRIKHAVSHKSPVITMHQDAHDLSRVYQSINNSTASYWQQFKLAHHLNSSSDSCGDSSGYSSADVLDRPQEIERDDKDDDDDEQSKVSVDGEWWSHQTSHGDGDLSGSSLNTACDDFDSCASKVSSSVRQLYRPRADSAFSDEVFDSYQHANNEEGDGSSMLSPYEDDNQDVTEYTTGSKNQRKYSLEIDGCEATLSQEHPAAVGKVEYYSFAEWKTQKANEYLALITSADDMV